MTLKHVLKHFSKTEVQDDERFSLAPMREREQTSYAKHTVKNLFTYLPIHLFTFKKAAFTLAEVLITLAIIGVVAALTLPTLIQNHQKQAYVTGLKKAYANLQNAFAKMAYDEDVTEWSQTYCFSDVYTATSKECFNRFKKQFNVVKSEKFELDDDGVLGFSPFDISGYFHTNDGMTYLIACWGIDDVLVDVNGDKGPNKWGRDRFLFNVDVDKNKVVPEGINNYQTYCTTANANSNDWQAGYCTAKVLIEGKMDY